MEDLDPFHRLEHTKILDKFPRSYRSMDQFTLELDVQSQMVYASILNECQDFLDTYVQSFDHDVNLLMSLT